VVKKKLGSWTPSDVEGDSPHQKRYKGRQLLEDQDRKKIAVKEGEGPWQHSALKRI